MKRTGLAFAALFGVAVVGYGCGGGSSGTALQAGGGGGGGGQPGPGATAPAGDATGVWDGTFSSSAVPSTPVSVDLTQTGSAIAGTYSASSGATGTFAGTIRGSVVDFTMTSTMAACAGSFAGTGTLSGDTLDLTFAGSDCGGTYSGVRALLARPATGAGATTTGGGLAGTPIRPFERLPFRVSDAEYSTALDRIIAGDASANAIRIYDPATGAAREIPLRHAASVVSVALDGKTAVAATDFVITHVDLVAERVLATVTLSATCNDAVLAPNGFVYAFPKRSNTNGIGGFDEMSSIDLTTGKETLTAASMSGGSYYYNSSFLGAKARLHPGGTTMYIMSENAYYPEKLTLAGGPAQSMYKATSWYGRGAFWITEDGLRLIGADGKVARCSSVQTEDMTAAGALPMLNRMVQQVAHSKAAKRLAVIPAAQSSYYASDEDGQVELFGYDGLDFQRAVRIPDFEVAGRFFTAHGRYLFYNRAGNRLYVLAQADTTSNLIQDWAVFTH